MTNTHKIFYLYLSTTLAIIFVVETALEYRHFNLGYTTPIFGRKTRNNTISSPKSKNNNTITYTQEKKFPFDIKEKFIKKNKAVHVWIASASHAVGGRIHSKNVFPNLLCDSMQLKGSCKVINGSKEGMTVPQNVALLEKYSSYFKPDYALLYQMSMIMAGQQRRLIQGDKNLPIKNKSILDLTKVTKLFQSLSLYGHLTDYIGGNIKLSGQLKNSLPRDLEEDFRQQILSFIDACNKNEVKPVLVSFAASHNIKNIHQMNFTERTNFVKYNTYLSPVGWINVISLYNNILRSIATKNNVDLIDIEKTINGRLNYFVDFVHFNKAGHRKVANILANELKIIISHKGSL